DGGETDVERDEDGDEGDDQDATLAAGRDSDATEADVTQQHTRTSKDGDGEGDGEGDEGDGDGTESVNVSVREHPLRLDVHPPSPPPWETAHGDGDEDEDGDLGRGRGGRASPRRFEFSGAGSKGRMHEFGGKPSSSRPLIPHSAYYFGPPPPDSAYGSEPIGQIGVHHPREVLRVERDYTGGELPQFTPTYPLELEGRITPTQFLETINAINEMLLSAHSLGHAFIDNALAYFTLQITRAMKKTHYEKEMDRLHALIDSLNLDMYNPVGLHIRWPRDVALLFLEIEYY
ncbi:Golgin subfamily A member 7/ERF4 family-domain-containing protein, partial [Epithele typhae]|uniref:Golgin subfamily A member 7/ERF4 family-domain-containing protein n=1 Tax=Epithele typhae TaxID=378194 RepID=UPI0020088196